MRRASSRLAGAVVLLTLVLLPFAPIVARAATIVIVNSDSPGEGFNDPTPVAPVGGNNGVTLGQQRQNVFQAAANIWGNILSSAVTIRVAAQFNPLACDSLSAILGSAGASSLVRNFANAEYVNTWYPVALASRLAGTDQSPASDDINAQFSSALDGGTCLRGKTWYYGLDGLEPANKIELLPVVLHELGHGLGFAQYANTSTGTLFSGGVDIYQRFLFDNSTGLHWNQMNDTQRATSAINTGHLVWDGPAVVAMAPNFLGPRSEVRVTAPAGISGLKVFGTASFGPAVNAGTISGQVVLAVDGVAPTSDGCSALTNAGAMAGKIALIDRGACAFVQKTANAQAAGAIAVVIANNVAGSPPEMGGTDPSITIPTVSISQADGQAIKANLGSGVFMTMGLNPLFLAGADDNGRVLVYTPNPVEPGSTVSHWDVSAEPSLLMEPFITDGLSSSVDLTKFAFEDIGWFQPRVTGITPTPDPGPVTLRASFPNPFTITTRIGFDLPQAGHAEIVIFDIAGRQVKHLVSADMPAGNHGVTWDGSDDAGQKVPPGVFFYRLTAPGYTASKRMVRVSTVAG